jgi:MoaA/NifB/PqqE/SkfB family radical SAM enzyme
MPKIYKLVPTDNVFSITWNIGTRCNYDCMYCPPSLHDSTSRHPNLELLQQRWQSIYSKTSDKNLPYKISFTGGEVSSNKSFLPLLKWLRTNYGNNIFKILVTSNGSASLRYYTRLFELADNLSLSFHSEHADENKFFDQVIALHKNLPMGKHLHVNIMDERWNQHRIPLYTDILSKHSISYNVNKIDYSKATRIEPIMKGKQNLAI